MTAIQPKNVIIQQYIITVFAVTPCFIKVGELV